MLLVVDAKDIFWQEECHEAHASVLLDSAITVGGSFNTCLLGLN